MDYEDMWVAVYGLPPQRAISRLQHRARAKIHYEPGETQKGGAQR